jgi:hypothetical protein
MAETIQEAALELSRRQTPTTYEDTESFHGESIQTLNKIIKTVRKYVPKLRRGLRVELAALNVTLGKLETAVRSLGLAIEQSPGGKIELIRREIKLLEQAHQEQLKLKTEQAGQKKTLEANDAKEKEILTRNEEFISNTMFQELGRYQESLKTKEEEIKQFLQPIAKPLAKLERKELDAKNRTLDLATLRGLVERPVETVVTGQTYAMNQLLSKLREALEQGDLEIEERRRRKAEETIQQANSGTMEKLRQDYLTIQANEQESLRQLKTTGLLDKKNEAEQAHAANQDEKQRLTTQILELSRRSEAVGKTMQRQIQTIEQQTKKVTGKELKINVEN